MLGEEKSSITLQMVQKENMNKGNSHYLIPCVSRGFCWVGRGRYTHAAGSTWQQSSPCRTSEHASTQVSTATAPEGQGSVTDLSGNNIPSPGSPGTSTFGMWAPMVPPVLKSHKCHCNAQLTWPPIQQTTFGWKGQDLKAACSLARASSMRVQDAHLLTAIHTLFLLPIAGGWTPFINKLLSCFDTKSFRRWTLIKPLEEKISNEHRSCLTATFPIFPPWISLSSYWGQEPIRLSSLNKNLFQQQQNKAVTRRQILYPD